MDTIFGEHEQVYKGPGASTSLKVAGVGSRLGGDGYGRDEDCEAIVSANPAEGVYRKAVVKVDSGVGTVLLGDVAVGPRLTQTVKCAMLAEEVAGLIVGRGYASEIGADSLPDEAQIYNCNGISKR